MYAVVEGGDVVLQRLYGDSMTHKTQSKVFQPQGKAPPLKLVG